MSIISRLRTVNVLKFRTLFSFCSHIKCWFKISGLELINKMLVRIAIREDPDQSLIWVCVVCLGLSGRQQHIVFKILEIYRMLLQPRVDSSFSHVAKKLHHRLASDLSVTNKCKLTPK